MGSQMLLQTYITAGTKEKEFTQSFNKDVPEFQPDFQNEVQCQL